MIYSPIAASTLLVVYKNTTSLSSPHQSTILDYDKNGNRVGEGEGDLNDLRGMKQTKRTTIAKTIINNIKIY